MQMLAVLRSPTNEQPAFGRRTCFFNLRRPDAHFWIYLSIFKLGVVWLTVSWISGWEKREKHEKLFIYRWEIPYRVINSLTIARADKASSSFPPPTSRLSSRFSHAMKNLAKTFLTSECFCHVKCLCCQQSRAVSAACHPLGNWFEQQHMAGDKVDCIVCTSAHISVEHWFLLERERRTWRFSGKVADNGRNV